MTSILVDASNNLRAALDQYLNACSSIQKSFITRNTSKSLPEELASRIKLEVQLCMNYESKLQEAKSAISWTRNSSALAPASTLPCEILSHIFYTALAGCPKLTRTLDSYRPSPSCSLNDRLIPHAKVYAERSGQLPLHIHICGTSKLDNRLIEFITSVAARIGSLDLDVRDHSLTFHSGVLEVCLKGCTPGVFTGLIVREAGGTLVQANDGKSPVGKFRGEPLLFDLPEKHIEDILSRSTILSLDGILFPWADKIYHNLVELRLFCSSFRKRFYISEAQLHKVLKSCPQLRILEFDLGIDDEFNTALDEPIHLEKLTTLALRGEIDCWAGFLRSITTGSNPLHLFIDWDSDSYNKAIESYPMEEEFSNFFTRSNVTKLTLTGLDNSSPVFDILQYATNVQELALDEVLWEEEESIGPRLNTNVDTLYLLQSELHMRDLQRLVYSLRPEKLICWGRCYIASREGFSLDTEGQGMNENLLDLCPMVEFLPDSVPKPMGSRY